MSFTCWPAFRAGYGDGILTFRITELSPDRNCEQELAAVAFAANKGPHTVDAKRGRLLFNWYEERVDLLAGFRRLLHRL